VHIGKNRVIDSHLQRNGALNIAIAIVGNLFTEKYLNLK
jgi:hypothetical protein